MDQGQARTALYNRVLQTIKDNRQEFNDIIPASANIPDYLSFDNTKALKLDKKNGYIHVYLRHESQEQTAFGGGRGIYENVANFFVEINVKTGEGLQSQDIVSQIVKNDLQTANLGDIWVRSVTVSEEGQSDDFNGFNRVSVIAELTYDEIK